MRTAYRTPALGLLKPGGLLIGVWFIDPEHDEGYEGPPHALPVAELDALSASTSMSLRTTCPTSPSMAVWIASGCAS